MNVVEVHYLKGFRRPSEVQTISEEPAPHNRMTNTGIRCFLVSQRITSPLTDALNKTEHQKVHWEETTDFEAFKEALMRQSVLRAPDSNRHFDVQCDASKRGLGVVLSQTDDEGKNHPILT